MSQFEQSLSKFHGIFEHEQGSYFKYLLLSDKFHDNLVA